MKRAPLRLPAIFGLFALTFMTGMLVGKSPLASSDKSAADRELSRLRPQIDDAIRRWSLKTQQSEKSVRESYEPRSMFIPTRNQGDGMVCIELDLKPGSLGGSPVYCYQDDFSKPEEAMKLVADYSDVE